MSRIIWKGALSFGLINIPVVLKPASRDHTLDLDLLDVRDMAPVGYQRVNKRTGKVIDKEHIVKGYQYEKDEYVLLNDEDFRQANVEATHTVDIVSFVDVDSIPPYYFETPYFLEPDKRGEKGYALLRETMRKTRRAALALVVLRNRQHLATVLAVDKALVLNTMRFADEILPMSDLRLPEGGSKGTNVNAREIDMAVRLVEEMSEDWAPEAYRDTYRDDLMGRIEEKIAAGKTHELTPAAKETAEPRQSAKIIDMVGLLKQSLEQHGGPARGRRGASAGRAKEAESQGEEAPPPAASRKRAAAKSSATGSPKKPAAKKSARAPARTSRRKAA